MSGFPTEQEAIINIDNAVMKAIDGIETSVNRFYREMVLRPPPPISPTYTEVDARSNKGYLKTQGGGGMCENNPKIKLAVNAIVILALVSGGKWAFGELNESFNILGLVGGTASTMYNFVSTSITSVIEVGRRSAMLAGTTSGAVVDTSKEVAYGVKNTLSENIGNLFSFASAASVGRYYKTGISAAEDYKEALTKLKLAQEDIIAKRDIITRSMSAKLDEIQNKIKKIEQYATEKAKSASDTATDFKSKYTILVDMVCNLIGEGETTLKDVSVKFSENVKTHIGKMLNVTNMNAYDGKLKGGRKSKRRNTRKSSKSRKNKKSHKKHKKKSHKTHKKKSHKGKKHKKKTNKRR